VFRGGRIVDLAGGHGLLAQIMLVLDDSSSGALVVDKMLPVSRTTLHEALVRAWPRLSARVTFVECELDSVDIMSTDVVVSSHACGRLTDVVLDRAAAARARVAVLPCCHDLASPAARDLSGWIDGAAAIDVERAVRLRQRGYKIRAQTIPAGITPKNRLLIGEPAEG
jgi:methyltransferase family protein